MVLSLDNFGGCKESLSLKELIDEGGSLCESLNFRLVSFNETFDSVICIKKQENGGGQMFECRGNLRREV